MEYIDAMPTDLFLIVLIWISSLLMMTHD